MFTEPKPPAIAKTLLILLKNIETKQVLPQKRKVVMMFLQTVNRMMDLQPVSHGRLSIYHVVNSVLEGEEVGWAGNKNNQDHSKTRDSLSIVNCLTIYEWPCNYNVWCPIEG